MERAGVPAAPDVVVVEPQGYRSSLALQLHAAAVITDSGGVQRESAWLGVPCVVLRESTEWLEAVAESAGRMVVVGLDAEAAVAALARLAPPTEAAAIARARAAAMRVAPAGAAEAIAAALDHP
jgi:UDP-N-acetylglucosamine 2-epimerase